MSHVINVVGTRPALGDEERFHDWYAEHIRTVMQHPGVIGATRYRNLGRDADRLPFLCIYKFRSAEDFRDYNAGPILKRAEEERHHFWNGPGFDVQLREQFEPIASFTR